MITKEFEKGRTNAKKEIRNENPFRIFENEKFGKIEVLFKDDQFYFPAIEIAGILGYKNPRDAVKRHCVNEFPYVVKHDVGINTGLAVQTIQKKYINEGNLYRLIAKSKLPEAREFERWIFDTVIPSIRKNGYYSNAPQIDERDRAKLAVIENKNKISNIHQNKGLTFRWTLIGIEAIKEILLSKNYIIKDGNVYSANPETLKEFKKKYKEWKEKK